jgi:surface polysaccharide O-acyltransferase-like enzyme
MRKKAVYAPEKMLNTVKVNWMTLLQTVAIFLVVVGHSVPGDNLHDMPSIFAKVSIFIYSFHMPLFMAISGFLFVMTNANRSLNYIQFTSKKAVRLLIPYVVISSLAFIPKYVLNDLAARRVNLSWHSYLHSLFYPGDNVIVLFWFLPTLFLIFTMSPALVISLKKTVYQFILAFIFLFLNIADIFYNINILNIGGVVHYLFYFYMGCIMGLNKKNMVSFFNEFTVTILAGSVLVTLNIVKFAGYDIAFGNKLLINFYQVITAISGIMFAFSLCITLHNHQNYLRIFNGFSYQIFLLSWFFQVACKMLFKIGLTGIWTTSLLMILFGMVGPVIIAMYFKRYAPQFKLVLGF